MNGGKSPLNRPQTINMAANGDDCITAAARTAAAIATFAYIRPVRRLAADVDICLNCEGKIDATEMGWQELRVGKNFGSATNVSMFA